MQSARPKLWRSNSFEGRDGPQGLSGAIPLFRTKHGRGFQWKARADAVPLPEANGSFAGPA